MSNSRKSFHNNHNQQLIPAKLSHCPLNLRTYSAHHQQYPPLHYHHRPLNLLPLTCQTQTSQLSFPYPLYIQYERLLLSSTESSTSNQSTVPSTTTASRYHPALHSIIYIHQYLLSQSHPYHLHHCSPLSLYAPHPPFHHQSIVPPHLDPSLVVNR